MFFGKSSVESGVKHHKQNLNQAISFKGILKLILVIFCILISLKYHFKKGSKWIFVQEAKIQLIEKPQDMTELSTNYVTFTKIYW
jgi:hypothetical protein